MTPAEEWKWDTWVVSVTGGPPQLMWANANSLRWLTDGRILFSEFRTGAQLAIAVADEGRGNQRDVYVPDGQGMAHYSDLFRALTTPRRLYNHGGLNGHREAARS